MDEELSPSDERQLSAEADAHELRAQERSRAMQLFNRQQHPIKPAQGTPLGSCPTNLDLTSARDKALAVKGMGPGELELKDGMPLRILCTRYLIVPDSRIDDKTGEISEFVRCVLFDASGKHFRTTAAHGPFRVRALLELYEREEWEQGIPLIISERKSKRGTVYHDIQVDLERL